MVCDENDCHYKMSGNPAGTVTYRKATLWFCMHSFCALLFGGITLRNYLSLITCWQAVLNSDKACFTNEIRAAFQPFNILNVHYQEKAKNLFLSSQLQTSTGIRILTCKALSPLQIQKLLFHAICLLVFFICFNVFSLFISLLFCVSIFCSLERERDGAKGFIVMLFSRLHIWDVDSHARLEYFLLHLHIAWLCFFLPLTQTHNQTLAAFSSSNLPWAKTQWLHICTNFRLFAFT